MVQIALPLGLADKLGDLGDFGIHILNKRGFCHKCGKHTRPYSEGYSYDAFCKECLNKTMPNGGDYDIYSPATVWVIKGLWGHSARERYDIAVKIDGRLYTGRSTGGTYSLNDPETGQEIEMFALQYIPTERVLEQWYLAQGNPVVHSHVVQLVWYQCKDEVSSEIHHHVNWANNLPIYDLGHNGRGWEADGRVYVRMYLGAPKGAVNRNDFQLHDIQLVKEANAPFLDGYQVARFPETLINLMWSQAGEIILRVFGGIKTDSEMYPSRFQSSGEPSTMLRLLDGVREYYHELALRYPMPTDAWITLIISNDRDFGSPTAEIRHKLHHLIIHPF